MKLWKSWREFGFKYTFKSYYYRALAKFTKKHRYREAFFANIENYLQKHYANCLPTEQTTGVVAADFPVWVFWWQGADNLPDIVQTCLASLRQHLPGHQINLLTKDNLADFVTIPAYIRQKLDQKMITVTHFSDILRAALLAQYGGLWVDATVFLTADLADDLIGKPFYTQKMGDPDAYKSFVSRGQWSGFFMAGAPGNPLFVGLREVFYQYWAEHNFLIDYLLIDYTIAFLRKNCPAVKALMDAVPVNNEGLYYLATHLFQPYDKQTYAQLTQNTKVHKLTWKFAPEMTQVAGTYYQRLVAHD